MRKLFPLILALIGLAGGVGAGLALKPSAEPAPEAAHAEGETSEESESDGEGSATSSEESEDEAAEGEEVSEFVKLNNQFVVPVVKDGRVDALVVMSISLEVMAETRETVFQHEPKLRDAFLQVLFDHANAGGFDGMFTTSDNLRLLRRALLEAAQNDLGETVRDVLITDLVRQDI